jgi:hypothetical protein
MLTFHLTSIAWTGYIEFVFNDNYLLDKRENHAELSKGQHEFLVTHLPAELCELEQKLKTSNTTITEIKENITFEMFWDRYDDKINSSKFKTERQWNKMNPVDQSKAYHFIPRYFAHVPQGTRKKYATTYLSDQLWNN